VTVQRYIGLPSFPELFEKKEGDSHYHWLIPCNGCSTGGGRMDEKISKKGSARSSRALMARYANYFEVGHNAYEFLVDFGQFHPEAGAVALHTRIALGPIHAKMLSQMFGHAVLKYEAENGEIALEENSLDPSQIILRSLPDFEQRAADARRSERTVRTDAHTNPVSRKR
jgi:hypothetical protein